MNVKKILALLIITVMVFSGCTTTEKKQEEEQVDLKEKAVELVNNLNDEQYWDAYKTFSEDMKNALPLSDLESVWNSVGESYGKFQDIIDTRIEIEGEYQYVYVTCKYSVYGYVDLRVVYNPDKKVDGLQFVDATSDESYTIPDYVNQSKFTSTNITIGQDPWVLPATLTMPEGEGSFPVVILVHGSGPNDRDESIGPNKPLKDIALGLSSQGIAVLRYDKRSFVYPNKIVNISDLSPQEEIIDDVLAAINNITSYNQIDTSNIFVLGHSIGAMMAPEIAQQTDQIEGLILLAAPARPIEDLILSQSTYLINIDKAITPAESNQSELIQEYVNKIKELNISEDEIIFNVPKSYWEYLSTYDQIEEMQKLSIPLYFLQGKRDYQVTYSDDFLIWKNTFENDSSVSFDTYDSLNHLFISGSGPPTNTEYQIPGNVEETVINDIVTWIKDQV